MKKDEIIQSLIAMPDWEFIETLRNVFEARVPFPETIRYEKTRFFLGMAVAQLWYDSGYGEQIWSDWSVVAVAYPDEEYYQEHYPSGYSADLGEGGKCFKCGTKLVSNAKHALCPVCGQKNGLT